MTLKVVILNVILNHIIIGNLIINETISKIYNLKTKTKGTLLERKKMFFIVDPRLLNPKYNFER